MTDAAAALQQGVALLAAGRFHEAHTAFLAALRQQPAAIEPRVGLSQACQGALSFNGMGLPCVMRSGLCTNWDANGNAVGVVYFLQNSRHSSSAWAAVAVTPAGRARTWLWSSGSSQWVAQ